MDKRLLRMWSNFGLVMPRLFQLCGLTVSLWGVCSSEVRAAPPQVNPVVFGELEWDARNQTMAGVMTFARTMTLGRELTEDHSDEFWLLPNRDLSAANAGQTALSRDQREFRTVAGDVEWPLDDSGLGALVIQGVAVAKLAKPCPMSAEEAASQLHKLTLSPATFEFRDSERVLRVAHESGNGNRRAQGDVTLCRVIRMSFTAHPRLGNGNFVQRVDGSASFSGPVFPVWRVGQTQAYLRLSSKDEKHVPRCATCRSVNGKVSILTFWGLPPPIHFESPESDEALVLKNLEPANRPELSAKLLKESRELNQTLAVFRSAISGALNAAQQRSAEPWQLRLTRGQVIEQLLTEQVDEIQLNSSFGLVTPFLSDYHRAALFRALSRSFVRSQLANSPTGYVWQQRRTDETVARLLAELWMQQTFPNLSKLRELADQFSFLPFFRAVQQGNAFVNNAVFVGAEESPSRLDYSIFDDFFSPMKGAELVERIDACSSESARREVRELAFAVLQGRVSARDFSAQMASKSPNADCTVPFEVGLIPAITAQERVEIMEADKKQGRLRVVREILPATPTSEFLFAKASMSPQEPLRLQLSKTNLSREQIVLPPSERSVSATELPVGVESVEVVSPHRAISDDRLRYPRPMRSVLQALSVNYDSRKKDVAVRSQIQFTQVGDEWGRALSVGWRREDLGNYFDAQVATRIPSLIRETRSGILLSTSTRLVQAPPSFISVSYSVEQGSGSALYPNGIGLRLWLRRPLTLSAFRETMRDPEQEWLMSASVALAPRLTWSESISFGRSEAGIDAGLRSVPGWPAGTFFSKEYAVIRSEIRRTLAQNLNASIARSVLFQHAILYAAHIAAFDDLQAAQQGAVDARTAQSLLMGVRLLGALFGAKDQALGFEVARALTSEPRTSFGLTLGKSFN